MSVSLPCGVHNKSYAQELIIVRTPTQWVFLMLGLATLFTLPLYASGYILNVVNYIGIILIAVIGLHILLGCCGQISIGQSAFMGIGAYTTAILINQAGFSFWTALPCAIFVTGLLGVIVGLPSLRVKGFYLAMATLAAQVIIPWIIGHWWVDVTGGMNSIDLPAINVLGNPLTEQQQLLYVIWPLALLGAYFAVNITRSRSGRAFIAIRDNDLAAEVMGVNLFKYKLLAFFICSLYAGCAGALWAEWVRVIAPSQFTLANSVLYLGMLIVGGMGRNAGTFFGVSFLIILDEAAKSLAPRLGALLNMPSATLSSALGPITFGLVIMIFLVFEPRGLAHRWEMFKSFYRLNPFSY